jgi:hypothetical protein
MSPDSRLSSEDVSSVCTHESTRRHNPEEQHRHIHRCESRLGGVVVSVLTTGPKGCGFEPGQGDGFLREIKIRSTPSSRMGSIAGRSHVVRFYGM